MAVIMPIIQNDIEKVKISQPTEDFGFEALLIIVTITAPINPPINPAITA